MRRIARVVLFWSLFVGSSDAPALAAPVQEPARREGPLPELRELLAVARAARAAGDEEEARRQLVDLHEWLCDPGIGDEEPEAVAEIWAELAPLAKEWGQPELAVRAWRAALAHCERTLPAEHELRLAAREKLAIDLLEGGDAESAIPLFEASLEARRSALAVEAPEVVTLMWCLALARLSSGDFERGSAASEALLEVLEASRPADDPLLVDVRAMLAMALVKLGELTRARELLEAVLEVRERTLEDDHADLLYVRRNLGALCALLGDLRSACAHDAALLEVLERTLPPDDPALLVARESLATTMADLGECAAALPLQLAVFEARERSLPDDHAERWVARTNLAALYLELGEPARARALLEPLLAIQERTLPSDHEELQATRSNLAATYANLGDLAAARVLAEAVLEVRERTLSPDDPSLQTTRSILAGTLLLLGEADRARALFAAVVESHERSLPADHPGRVRARTDLAAALHESGDVAGARAVLEDLLEQGARAFPDGHVLLLHGQVNLAGLLLEEGELEAARAQFERALAGFEERFAAAVPILQHCRAKLAATIAGQVGLGAAPALEGRAACVELVLELCRHETEAARALHFAGSVREAEERSARHGKNLARALSLAAGYGVIEPLAELDAAAFELSETARGAGLAAAAFLRAARGDARYEPLRAELAQASESLAALAQQGATSAEYHALRARREAAERALAALSSELGAAERDEFAIEALGEHLGERDALVAWRSFDRRGLELVPASDGTGAARLRPTRVDSLCAFVLRGGSGEAGARLALVQLGELGPVDAAVRAWREALGTRIERGIALRAGAEDELTARGAELRRLVLDPLLPHLEDCDRLIAVPDDVLHLVPLDALPAPEVEELVGDRWRVELRHTVRELLEARPARGAAGALVALGGASFQSPPVALEEEELATLEPDTEPESAIEVAAILRGGAWERGFSPLTYSGLEAREIAALHAELFEAQAGSLVLEKRRASRPALEAAAPRARWLHVATHGWFAPESVRSWEDVEAPDADGLVPRLSGAEVVRGMSPMLLCGLALAGANLPADALGRVPGLITAEELSTLDLTTCELAVLSACDTNVGERRAGQGVASLQKALHMAGARSVITSLWKVPDEATRELMLDFYRRIWLEKKPKSQALWEAKKRLRDARDERGEPLYTTRDWAAWVLTGEPD